MKTIATDKQQGAVLIVSLLMLMVMTMIGVTALSGTSLEEKMSLNYQHSTLTFQAAESAIEKVIVSGDVGGAGELENPFYVEANDPLIASLNKGLNVAEEDKVTITADLDPDGNIHNATLISTTKIVYTGKSACPETSFDELICYQFDVSAEANLSSSNTKELHVQGIDRPAPGIS